MENGIDRRRFCATAIASSAVAFFGLPTFLRATALDKTDDRKAFVDEMMQFVLSHKIDAKHESEWGHGKEMYAWLIPLKQNKKYIEPLRKRPFIIDNLSMKTGWFYANVSWPIGAPQEDIDVQNNAARAVLRDSLYNAYDGKTANKQKLELKKELS